ncbi:MAG: DEAD/DEAH box helicase family protein [Endozoicomonadaceae bacterium]|nr:DEAD/DEAH box helicase family protein [Endozoicomonadaceae bacterium]
MLSHLNLNEKYRTGDSQLINDFYTPCLRNSQLYDRAVAYFRSSVFLLIGFEILNFAKHGGKIRLICSPSISQIDIDALVSGYKSREELLDNSSSKEIDELFHYPQIAKNVEALATLIAVGSLEVKIAFKPETSGIFHEKLGLFYSGDEIISFKGSINESWSGWHERGNNEAFSVFCSWLGGRDEREVKSDKRYFEGLWNNEISGLSVECFPDIALERLKVIAKGSLDDIDPYGLTDFFTIGDINCKPSEMSQMLPHQKRTPLKHQLEAIKAWNEQGKQGVLEHATGSGKTFTAITALKEHLRDDGVAVVFVPDRLLHKQWSEEIKEELPGATVLKVGDGHNRWRKNKVLSTFTQPGTGLGQRVVLATMQTAKLNEFINGIWQGQHLMVVADEVHEIGSKENSKALEIDSGPRLGLSATPRRYGDPVGTAKIFHYFGQIIKPPFTLEDAIKQKRLVGYEYFPTPLNLTAEESEEWKTYTTAISKEYARSKRDTNDKPIVSAVLQNMLIQRSRIAKKAAAKVPYAVNILSENFIEGQSWLVYCEDQYQLTEVIDALHENGIEACEYHTNMRGDAEASLDWFKCFGGIMVSIRCLDQGVDIPKISHAVILSSSQNPRQFIQRRGRILRTYPDKHKAVIYDAIIIPICLEDEPAQLSLLKSELQRSIHFSKTAINRSGANQLMLIAIELGIDPKEFGLFDTDGIEEPGEDNGKQN